MIVTPLHDRIVVARLEDPEPLPGAILIPDSAKETRLNVLAVEAPDLNAEAGGAVRAA